MRTFICASTYLAIAVVAPAHGQLAPPTEPILRIETGMHVAPIIRIGVNKNCTLALTGSKDKSARLWILPPDGHGEPELYRALRVPIGSGPDEGKIFAVALSPDGRVAAVGGWDVFPEQRGDHAVYVFETATGNLVRRLTGLGSVIRNMAFSPDGAFLAVTISDHQGLKVWKASDWTLVGEDKDYDNDSYGAGFDSKGRLYTVALDGFIRRYDQNFRLDLKAKTSPGSRPFTVAVHPSDGLLAVGFDRSSAVAIYSAADLRELYTPDTTGFDEGGMNSVAWSGDGGRLFAAGNTPAAERTVRIWEEQGRGQHQSVVVAKNNFEQLATCGAHVAVATDDPAFGLLSTAGERILWQEGVTIDTRESLGRNFMISANGARVRFGLGFRGDRPVLFDAAAGKLSDSTVAPPDLAPADVQSLPVRDWRNHLSPRLADKHLLMQRGEFSRSVAIAPDAKGMVLGAEWHLRAFSPTGDPVWAQPVAAGAAWGVNVSRDGRFVVAAFGDGTIRWHRLDTGEELLALFVNAKTREWVLWTPQGYYDSSPGGDKYIGWHINKGWLNFPDFIAADQLKQHFFRPDIVKRVLATASSFEALAETKAASLRVTDLVRRKPPEFTIIDPSDKARSNTRQVTVTLQFASNNDAVQRLTIVVNGRNALDAPWSENGSASAERALDVPLNKGENRIAISATNAVGEVVRNLLVYSDDISVAEKRGKLYIIAAGVNTYGKLGAGSALQYAAADARAVAEALAKKMGRLHSQVITQLLVSKGATPPTRSNIRKALQVFAQTNIEDTAVLFLAGHGTNEGRDYLFLPEDAEQTNGHWRKSSVLMWQELQQPLQKARGRRIMLVDTCHSGGAYNPRLVKDAADASIVVFSATDSDTAALELDSLGHGVFSYAVVQGLNGKADLSKQGTVNVLELGGYISREIKRLTNGAQEPTFSLASSRNFVLGLP